MKVLNSLECNEGDGDDDDDTLHIVLMFGTFRLSSYVPSFTNYTALGQPTLKKSATHTKLRTCKSPTISNAKQKKRINTVARQEQRTRALWCCCTVC